MLNPVQFRPARTITAGEIALLTGARLMNPASESLVVRNLAPADRCNDGDLTYVDGKAGRSAESALKASAVLCRTDVADAFSGDLAVLATESPRRHFAQVARLLFPDAVRPAAITGEYGISQQAHVHADTELEADVTIESGAVVGQAVAIGSGTIIAPNAVLGNGCRIGRNCYIGPGCSIVSSLIGDRVIIHAGARIGFDGFGYVPGRNGIEKVPQIGRVIIQDDVEIGTNVTIDRGALSDTVIGESTKIDNLVQVAHNVRIGRGCLIAAQSGLAGSCELGDYVMLGGQVGISDHIVIGKGAQIGAMSGVGSNVGAGQRWLGYPARPAADALRLHARLARLLRKNGKAGKQDV